jgi:UPF0716 family protein affecting phage T7 exclusion
VASALLLIAPGWWVTLAGIVLVMPVLVRQWSAYKRVAPSVPADLDVGYR